MSHYTHWTVLTRNRNLALILAIFSCSFIIPIEAARKVEVPKQQSKKATAPVASSEPSPTTDSAQAPAKAETKESPVAPEIVVTVTTRTPKAPRQIVSSFNKITDDEINRSQLRTVQQVLSQQEGMMVTPNGQRGATTAVFTRGLPPEQTLFLQDGLKVNTPFDNRANSFGAASTYNIESIEITRGPASSLYGSEAGAAAVLIQTLKGAGTPTHKVMGEFGTDNSYLGVGQSSGQVGKFHYSAAIAHEETDNERLNNEYDNDSVSVRFDYDITDALVVGTILNGYKYEFGTPGSTVGFGANDPNDTTTEENIFTQIYADFTHEDIWHTKLIAGTNQRRFGFDSPANTVGGFAFYNVNDNERYQLEWQNDFYLPLNNVLTAGVSYDHTIVDQQSMTYFANLATGTTVINQSTDALGLYLQDQWEIVKNLNLVGGLRFDNYDDWGDALTYRAGAAYYIEQTGTKIRGSYGTAFRAPNMQELYFPPVGIFSNPNLKPEETVGWEAGFDQEIGSNRYMIGAAFFQNYTDNAISGFPPVNLQKTETYGVESYMRVSPIRNWNNKFFFTWTEAHQLSPLVNQSRLIRRPRYVYGMDSNVLLLKRWTVGAGAQWVSGREDIGNVDAEDYFVGRVYSDVNVCEHLSVGLRCENITDERYAIITGFPEVRRSLFGSVTVKF